MNREFQVFVALETDYDNAAVSLLLAPGFRECWESAAFPTEAVKAVEAHTLTRSEG